MGDDNKIHHEYERVVVTAEGATAREIRIYGSGNRLMLEGWQVADDGGQTAWVSDAGAIAVFDQPPFPAGAGPPAVRARTAPARSPQSRPLFATPTCPSGPCAPANEPSPAVGAGRSGTPVCLCAVSADRVGQLLALFPL